MPRRTSSNSVIIADRIVTKFQQGVIISPLSRVKNIDVTKIPHKSYGSKLSDNCILGQLSEGTLQFYML